MLRMLLVLTLALGLVSCCSDPAATTSTGKSTCLGCPAGQPAAAERVAACAAAKAAVPAGVCPDPAKCKVTATNPGNCVYTTAPNAPNSDQWDTIATVTTTYTCGSK